MNVEIRSYQAPDGAILQYREWRPEQIESVVVNLHGIQSHSGWFTQSCEHLSRHGVRVVSLDRRGSGLNETNRGHATSHKQLIDDLLPVVKQLRAEEAGKALHLLGVCWGGKIAACFAGLYPQMVDSLLLSAPGFVAKVRPSPFECFLIAICSLIRPRRLFKIPIDHAEMFTSNPDRIAFIQADPLRLDLATARLMAESKRIDWRLKKLLPHITAPSLLMLSGHDPIVENEGTRALFNGFAAPEKRIELFENACHMLEFEAENTQYLDTLVGWIRQHS